MEIVTIDGTAFEVVCDICVLEQLQEDFGSVSEFEKRLLGVVRYEENETTGELVAWRGEPNIRANLKALTLMANEANEIAGREKHYSTKDFLGLKISTNEISEIAGVLHKEFQSCFRTKKIETAQSENQKNH